MTSSLQLRETGEGTSLRTRVVPRASRSEIDGVHDGSLRVRLKAPPVDGAANEELIGFIAKLLNVRKRDVEITSGERGRSKTLLIRGKSGAEILQSLDL